MTLVGTDPGIICDVSVAQVGRELAEIGYIGDPRRAALYVLKVNEEVMLSLIELVATRVIQRSGAKGIRLHVGLPGFAVGLELIHDVGDVDCGVVIVSDAIRRARGRSDVIWLAGVGDA